MYRNNWLNNNQPSIRSVNQPTYQPNQPTYQSAYQPTNLTTHQTYGHIYHSQPSAINNTYDSPGTQQTSRVATSVPSNVQQTTNMTLLCHAVIVLVRKYIVRDLTMDEKKQIVSKVVRFRFTDYPGVQINRLLDGISLILASRLQVESGDELYNKLRNEMLDDTDQSDSNTGDDQPAGRTVLKIDSVFNITDPYYLRAAFNPTANYLHSYICLDTKNRLVESSGSFSEAKWYYIDNTNLQVGGFNTVRSIKDLVGLRLYQAIFPRYTNLNTYSQRLSIFIKEFKSQSWMASATRSYHYLTRPVLLATNAFITADDFVILQTENIASTYWFDPPITTFSSMTLQFADPLDPVYIPEDNRVATCTYTASRVVFNFTAATGLPTDPFMIYVSGFTTANPTADAAAIAAINSSAGIRANYNSATSVYVDAVITAPIVGLQVNVYLASYRAIFYLEAIHLRNV